MLTLRRNLRIDDLVAGREPEILAALGINWPPSNKKQKHIECPFPDHVDKNPSGRWAAKSNRWYCSCDPRGGDVVDAVQRMSGLPFNDAAKWIRGALERPISAEAVVDRAEVARRAAAEAEKRAAKDKMDANQREATARLARVLFSEASEEIPLDFPYLKNKRIAPYAARFDRAENCLLIPMYADRRELRNLQRIYADGEKKFLQGSHGATGLFLGIGGGQRADRIMIVEGWATGASVHAATGLPVAVAFSSFNLPFVVQHMRRKCPRATLILAADDDPGGRHWSERAAGSVDNARVILPDFGPFRTDRQKDFNDLAIAFGVSAVARRLGVYRPVGPSLSAA